MYPTLGSDNCLYKRSNWITTCISFFYRYLKLFLLYVIHFTHSWYYILWKRVSRNINILLHWYITCCVTNFNEPLHIPIDNPSLASEMCFLWEQTPIYVMSESLQCCMTWWSYQMETFSALLALCAENSPVSGEFPAQRPVTRIFDVFFDLRLY